MNNALSWMNDLFRWLGKLIPRLTLVPPTHRGVLFNHKGQAKNKGAGLICWWPIASKLHAVPVTTLSVQVSARSMLDSTMDGGRLLPRVAICGLAVQYRVTDAVRASLATLNLQALVCNRVQGAIGRGWAGLASSEETVATAVRGLSAEMEAEFGVKIEMAEVTQVGQAVAVLRLNDWGHEDNDLELAALKEEKS